jgi:hypothetical protein
MLTMNKKEIIRYLQSIIAIPMLAIAVPFTGISSIPSLTALNNIPTDENSVIITQEEVARKEKAGLIDTYFKDHDAPLEGHGMKFVLEAEKNDIDWRLLPAIAMRESTGGKFACKKVPNSVFGYGSCRMSFDSIDKSIEIVAASLGGNNPNTSRYYDNKTIKQILKKYNSVIPNYTNQVIRIMKDIHDDSKEII